MLGTAFEAPAGGGEARFGEPCGQHLGTTDAWQLMSVHHRGVVVDAIIRPPAGLGATFRGTTTVEGCGVRRDM